MDLVVALLGAYLLGSIPTADFVARLATRGSVDIRTAGTGNPGAANAIKVLGTKWGLVILVVDVAKAVAACAAGWALAGPDAAHWSGTAAVVGHCYPVWTRGKGGKGVACSVGQCIVTFPIYFPIDLAVALVSSLAAFRAKAFAATVVSCACWVGGATVWFALDLPNLWGPDPTASLPLAAAASSAVIVERFVSAARALAARDATVTEVAA
ncbi:MAG TPA: glycerol-3-phosphate acyltransferase [Acidimicrobiales bacterium]|nr:glycerol-3-phosphate acyltransferase [Acidimicrobiales bacterium]